MFVEKYAELSKETEERTTEIRPGVRDRKVL